MYFKLAAYFLFIYIVNVRIYVERRTKKRPEFQIGIKLSTHFISYFFDVSCVHFACVADALIYLLYQKKISQMALLLNLYFLVGSGSGYRHDSNAFLFSLVNKPGWALVKLPQTGKYSSGRQYSIYDNTSHGPSFGGGNDIYISNYASSNRNSHSNLGYTYSPPSGYSYDSTFAKTFLAGTYHFTPGEIETLQSAFMFN